MSGLDVAPAHTALLVIDIQRDFAAPDGAMARGGADMRAIAPAVEQAKALVAAARAAGVVCAFSHVVAPDGAVGRAGTSGTEFVDPLPRADDLVVAKPRYSVFAHSGLAETLKARGIDTLVLCGLTTECCVQSTAWDAFERDFQVVIASDAVAAYQPELHLAALRALELSGAVLAPASAIAAAWK
jgi:ureidoacrylate peracid hydrolase